MAFQYLGTQASWFRAAPAVAQGTLRRTWHLGLMLCSGCLEILCHFLFESVIYRVEYAGMTECTPKTWSLGSRAVLSPAVSWAGFPALVPQFSAATGPTWPLPP